MSTTVKDLFTKLTNDSEYVQRVKEGVQRIMADGVINQWDVPDIVLIITDTYNTMSQVSLTYDDLPELIRLVYNWIVESFNLIPVEKRGEFERFINTAIKLVMLQPKIRQQTTKCLSCLPCFS